MDTFDTDTKMEIRTLFFAIPIILVIVSMSTDFGRGRFSERYYNENCDAPLSAKTSLSVRDLKTEFVGGEYDQVGIWRNFGPGPGNANHSNNDWVWKVKFRLTSPKLVKSISVCQISVFEAWSTRDEWIFGKTPYPLGVFSSDADSGLGKQLTTRYNQLIILPAGESELLIFGQKESSFLKRPKLKIVFYDGTVYIADLSTAGLVIPDQAWPVPNQAEDGYSEGCI